MGRLSGKVALITGAGGGIGRGIALRFGAEGAAVGVFDRTAAVEVAGEIRAAGGRAIALQGDVACARDVHGSVERLSAAFGNPTVLVHNAAIMPSGRIDETAETAWDRAFQVNAKGAYLTSYEVLPLMRQAGGGSIVFMASITGVGGVPGLAAYSATKGALISLARAMAVDHAGEGIRVNSVSPGTIDSPMLHEFVAAQQDPAATRRAFDALQPRGSIGSIDEVVNVFVFLASNESSYVNGANMVVDGAQSVKIEQPRL